MDKKFVGCTLENKENFVKFCKDYNITKSNFIRSAIAFYMKVIEKQRSEQLIQEKKIIDSL